MMSGRQGQKILGAVGVSQEGMRDPDNFGRSKESAWQDFKHLQRKILASSFLVAQRVGVSH